MAAIRVSFTLLALGRIAESEAAYHQTLERPTSDALSWEQRGYALAHLDRWGEALHAFEQALDLTRENEPASGDRYYAKGAVLAVLGRYEEALVALDRARALEPGEANVLYISAALLQASGRTEEAAETGSLAIALAQPSASTRFFCNQIEHHAAERQEPSVPTDLIIPSSSSSPSVLDDATSSPQSCHAVSTNRASSNRTRQQVLVWVMRLPSFILLAATLTTAVQSLASFGLGAVSTPIHLLTMPLGKVVADHPLTSALVAATGLLLAFSSLFLAPRSNPPDTSAALSAHTSTDIESTERSVK